MTAHYRSEGDTIDWINDTAADVTAGEIIDLGDDMVGMATSDVADGALGSLRVSGEFEITKETLADTFAVMGGVGFVFANNTADNAATANHRATKASTATDPTVWVLINTIGVAP